jgi:hypothetical protein
MPAMKREHLRDLLERLPGARPSSADSWTFGSETDASLFAQTGGDLLTVPRLETVELRPEYAVLTGAKGEALFFAYECIAGLRIDSKAAPASGGTSKSPPGFGTR